MFSPSLLAEAPLGNTLMGLQQNLERFSDNVDQAKQQSDECDPREQSCEEQQQTSEQLSEQEQLNQEALDSINDRLRSSGYQVDGLRADGTPNFVDSAGKPLARLGQEELGFSSATRNGNQVERYGTADRGISVEVVRDGSNEITDLRVSSFEGGTSGTQMGLERALVDIPANQLANLSDTDVINSNVGNTTTGSNNTGNLNTTNNGGAPTPATPDLPDVSLGAIADRLLGSARNLYDDTANAVGEIAEVLRNPQSPRPPTVVPQTLGRDGDAVTASDGATVYEISDSRAADQDRIAIVVDTGDRNVASRRTLAANTSVYDEYLVTSDLGSAEVRNLIDRYPGHRVDIMTHGATDGSIMSGRNSFMTADSDAFRNTFSGVSNDVCIYACSVGSSLYNADGSFNTNSLPYQLANLTGGTVTSFDRIIYSGGYATDGTQRLTLTAGSSNPYPNLLNVVNRNASTFSDLSTLYSLATIVP